MDIILNQSGSVHKWFIQSKDNVQPYDDYYVWHKGKAIDVQQAPNNWVLDFYTPTYCCSCSIHTAECELPWLLPTNQLLSTGYWVEPVVDRLERLDSFNVSLVVDFNSRFFGLAVECRAETLLTPSVLEDRTRSQLPQPQHHPRNECN